MRYIITISLLFFSAIAFAQFPNNPVKIRLGYQTTSKGLIYYGNGVPTSSPTGFMDDAYAYVDTLTNTIYLYDEPNDKWEFLADSVYHASTPSPAIMPLDSILIDTSFNNQDFDAGEMGWDETGAFRFGVDDNYSFAVGQDMYKEVHNTTGSAITIGTAVKMTGADGASNVFQIAPIDYPATGSEFLLGIVAVNIPAGEYGIVVQNGYVKKIDVDAEGWSLGDVLYLSENVPGALTDTIGDVKVAAVTKAGSNGTIYVRPDFYATNEIQTLSIDSTGRVFDISISGGNTVTFEDTNTQLTEAQVVDIVRDTGFLEVETDPVWISDSVNYSTKAYTDQAEQDAKDYADANDDSGTDDQTLQEVLAQGNTTSYDITFSDNNNIRNTSGQIIGTISSNGDIFRGWSSLGSVNRLDIGYLSSFNTIFRSAGNIGIATLSPSEKLHLGGSMFINKEDAGLIVDSGSNKRVGLMKYSGLEASFVHGNTIALRFGRVDQANVTGGNYTEEMRIATNGNVGIGTTGPQYKLDVNGTVGFPALSDGSPHTELVSRNSTTGELGYKAISDVNNWTINGTNIYSDISNSLDSATYSFAAGTDAGSNRDMNYQNAIGRFAGENNTGSYQNAFGIQAGQNNTGNYQNAFGLYAGQNNTANHQNAFGYEAGQYNTGIYQNAFGRNAGRNNTGDYQNAFGYGAGTYNIALDQNAFGRAAGQNNTAVEQNAFGFQAGRVNTGEGQNAFGRDAGELNTGDYQNAFGKYAGENNTGESQNAFGYDAGAYNTGNYQNAFGYGAGRYNTGVEQQAFGYFAGYYNQGNYNISIGNSAGRSVSTTLSNPGDYNTWLNYRAGYSITEGNDNIGIGRDAAYSLTTGSQNIYIGSLASPSSASATNETVIGYNVTGNGDNTVTIGNSSVVDTYLNGILNIDDVTQDNTETDVLVLQLDGEVQSRTVSSINAENTLQSVTDNGATSSNTITVGTAGGIRTEIQAGQIKQYLQTAEGTEQQVSSGTIWRAVANKIRRSYGNLSAESAIPGSGAAIEYKEWSGYNSADAGYVIGINREVESTGAFTSSGAAPMKMTYQFNNGTALQNLFELNSSQQVKIYGTPYMTNITEDNTETNVLVLQSDGEVQSRYIPNMESARNANDTTSGTGSITVSHSLGAVPSVTITNASISPYVFSVSSVSTTSFTFRVYDMTGAAVTSTSVNFDYQLIIP